MNEQLVLCQRSIAINGQHYLKKLIKIYFTIYVLTLTTSLWSLISKNSTAI